MYRIKPSTCTVYHVCLGCRWHLTRLAYDRQTQAHLLTRPIVSHSLKIGESHSTKVVPALPLPWRRHKSGRTSAARWRNRAKAQTSMFNAYGNYVWTLKVTMSTFVDKATWKDSSHGSEDDSVVEEQGRISGLSFTFEVLHSHMGRSCFTSVLYGHIE